VAVLQADHNNPKRSSSDHVMTPARRRGLRQAVARARPIRPPEFEIAMAGNSARACDANHSSARAITQGTPGPLSDVGRDIDDDAIQVHHLKK
jgi:hypothetical protein